MIGLPAETEGGVSRGCFLRVFLVRVNFLLEVLLSVERACLSQAAQMLPCSTAKVRQEHQSYHSLLALQQCLPFHHLGNDINDYKGTSADGFRRY